MRSHKKRKQKPVKRVTQGKYGPAIQVIEPATQGGCFL